MTRAVIVATHDPSDFHLDVFVNNPQSIRPSVVLRSVFVEVLAASDAETPMVNPTADDAVFHASVRQRRSGMRTLIRESKELPVDVEHADHCAVDNEGALVPEELMEWGRWMNR